MKISIVVAVAGNGVIGKDNKLLWRLSADLQRFKKLTSGHHILMGRKTFESIGKPLPNRISLVISRDPLLKIEGAVIFNTVQQAIDFAREQNEEELFIIGGGDIFAQTLPLASTIYLTEVKKELEGDVHFHYDPTAWRSTYEEFVPADEKNEYDSTYQILERIAG